MFKFVVSDFKAVIINDCPLLKENYKIPGDIWLKTFKWVVWKVERFKGGQIKFLMDWNEVELLHII